MQTSSEHALQSESKKGTAGGNASSGVSSERWVPYSRCAFAIHMIVLWIFGEWTTDNGVCIGHSRITSLVA